MVGALEDPGPRRRKKEGPPLGGGGGHTGPVPPAATRRCSRRRPDCREHAFATPPSTPRPATGLPRPSLPSQAGPSSRRCDPEAPEPFVDAETGFTYLRARYHDPTTGQFLSRDPLVAVAGSAHGYVDGNPLNYTEPLGLITWENVFSSRTLKIAALGLCVAALAVATAGTAPAVHAVVSVQSIGYVSTGLGVASTVLSAGVAYQDCAKVRDGGDHELLADLAVRRPPGTAPAPGHSSRSRSAPFTALE